MAILTTHVDPNSEEARSNAEQMHAMFEDFRARPRRLTELGAAGDEPSIARP